MPEKHFVPVDKLEKLVGRIFEKNGLTPEDAAILAGSLVDANVRGMHSHGVLRVENYIKRIQQGGTDPHAEIRIVRETPFSTVVCGADYPSTEWAISSNSPRVSRRPSARAFSLIFITISIFCSLLSQLMPSLSR